MHYLKYLLFFVFFLLSKEICAEIRCSSTITAPCTIRSSGNYALGANISFPNLSGNAITIAADNVILDMNGYNISGATGSRGMQSSARGIYAFGRSNVTIKNSLYPKGQISAFLYGVNLEAGNVYILDHVLATANWYIGVWVEGTNSKILSSIVNYTGGTLISPAYTIPIAVTAIGSGFEIRDTLIYGFTISPYTKEVVGVSMRQAANARVENNTIGIVSPRTNSWGMWVSDSIYSSNPSSVWVMGNRFINVEIGNTSVAPSISYLKGNLFTNVSRELLYTGNVVDLGDNFVVGSNPSPSPSPSPVSNPVYTIGTQSLPGSAKSIAEFQSSSPTSTYVFGQSSYASMRQWIGYSSSYSSTQPAGRQRFQFNGLVTGQTYYLNIYPSYATDTGTPFYARSVSGNAELTHGQSFVPNASGYFISEQVWRIRFIARSSSTVIEIGTDITQGAHFLHLDYVDTKER